MQSLLGVLGALVLAQSGQATTYLGSLHQSSVALSGSVTLAQTRLTSEFAAFSQPWAIDYHAFGSWSFVPFGNLQLDLAWVPTLATNQSGSIHLRAFMGPMFLRTSSGLLGVWPRAGVGGSLRWFPWLWSDAALDILASAADIGIVPAGFIRLDWNWGLARFGAEFPLHRYWSTGLSGNFSFGITPYASLGFRF